MAANSIRITVRHATAPDDLEEFASEKSARLRKFLRSDPRLEFTLEHAKVGWQGEVILHGSRHNERLVARDSHADPHGCVELLVEKIERQLEKGKERRKSHRGPSFSGDGKAPAEPGATDEPSYEQIVRRDLKSDGVPGRKRK